MNTISAEKLVFTLRHRVVLPDSDAAASGTSAVAARQVDAVLLSAGFKCSGGLLAALATLPPGTVIDLGAEITGWARELAGDHVRHNAYFIDFPSNVPDTLDFWMECIREALVDPAAGNDSGDLSARWASFIDLLSLPGYGRYRHTHEEMLARHDELIPALSDRITVLHLGGPRREEAAGPLPGAGRERRAAQRGAPQRPAVPRRPPRRGHRRRDPGAREPGHRQRGPRPHRPGASDRHAHRRAADSC